MSENYDEWRGVLRDARVPTPAAEAHGLLCGLLCAPAPEAAQAWVDELLAGVEPAPGSGARLAALAAAVGASLDSPDCDFTPLLPEDHCALDERVDALAEWCQGLLLGLGVGGIDAASSGGEIGEMLADVAAVARLESGPEATEEEERGYAELVEYLRVGVLLLRADPGPVGGEEER